MPSSQKVLVATTPPPHTYVLDQDKCIMLQLFLAWKLWSIEWGIQFQFLVVSIVAAISILISSQLCSWLRYCGEESCGKSELKSELKNQWSLNNNRVELRFLSSWGYSQCLIYIPHLSLKVYWGGNINNGKQCRLQERACY